MFDPQTVTVRPWLRGPFVEADDRCTWARRTAWASRCRTSRSRRTRALWIPSNSRPRRCTQGDSLKFTTCIGAKEAGPRPQFNDGLQRPAEHPRPPPELYFQVPVPAVGRGRGRRRASRPRSNSFKIPEGKVRPPPGGSRPAASGLVIGTGVGSIYSIWTVPQGLRDRGPRERRHTAEPLPHDPHLRLDPGQDPGPTRSNVPPEQATGSIPGYTMKTLESLGRSGFLRAGPGRRQGPPPRTSNPRCGGRTDGLPPGPEPLPNSAPPPVARPRVPARPAVTGQEVSHPYSRQS